MYLNNILLHDVVVYVGGNDGDGDDVPPLLDVPTNLLVLHPHHVLPVHLQIYKHPELKKICKNIENSLKNVSVFHEPPPPISLKKLNKILKEKLSRRKIKECNKKNERKKERKVIK